MQSQFQFIIISTTYFLLTLTIFTTLLPTPVLSAKILSLAFLSAKSHKITYEPLLYELAKRGHSVTIVSPFIYGNNVTNVREIQTIDVEEMMKTMPNMFEKKKNNEKFDVDVMTKQIIRTCSLTYDQPHIQELFNNANEKYDLVFLEAIVNECVAGGIYKLNTSLILLSPMLVPPSATGLFGNPSPPSFIPTLLSSSGDDEMNFYERFGNFISEGIFRFAWNTQVEPIMESIYREKLNDPNIPSVHEILRNASLVLSNSHFSLSKPKPFLPNIIEVGGMHCRPAKPLPKDLNDFIESSGSHGVIYFSMGSLLNATIMQESTRRMFVNTFAGLKQKVLWKWETENMKDLPKNVKLSKWLPQQDVLGHPKMKLFITHGGFGGATEAVYHGVPLLGIPMFGDQPVNMQKAEKAGYALSLDFATLSEEKLTKAINRILTEPRFTDKVKQLSSIFRDQPDKPLDRAVYWTEYVIRHKGALHLRSAARELNFVQFHSIDVISTILAIVLTAIFIVYQSLKFVSIKLCGRNSGKREYSANGLAKKQH